MGDIYYLDEEKYKRFSICAGAYVIYDDSKRGSGQNSHSDIFEGEVIAVSDETYSGYPWLTVKLGKIIRGCRGQSVGDIKKVDRDWVNYLKLKNKGGGIGMGDIYTKNDDGYKQVCVPVGAYVRYDDSRGWFSTTDIFEGEIVSTGNESDDDSAWAKVKILKIISSGSNFQVGLIEKLKNENLKYLKLKKKGEIKMNIWENVKKIFQRHEDTIFTLGIVILIDHFFLHGALASRVKSLMEAMIDSLEKSLKGAKNDSKNGKK